MLHAVLPLAVPGLVAWLFYRPAWRRAWLVLAAALLLDLAHVLATPLFDSNRCSLNFHPLHTYWAIGGYALLLLPRHPRLWAVGFLLHMALDYLACVQLGIWRP